MSFDRRQFLLRGSCGLGSAVLGLSGLDMIYRREVCGAALADTREFDATMMVYYEGGPSQADSFDVKPKGPGLRYPAVRLPGMTELYDQPVHVSELVASLCSIIGPSPSEGLGRIRMGFIRSMHHGIPVHQFAQRFTTGFWQSPVGFRYPPAAPVMAHYFRDHAATTGMPGSVFIRGQTGRGSNEMRGAQVPMALEVFGNPTGMAMMPQLLSQLQGVDYARRRELIASFSRQFDSGRSDSEVTGWATALDQAVELTLNGKAAEAFRLDKNALLGADNPNIYEGTKQRFSLAQQLIRQGVPFVNLGIGGNDDGHFNNNDAVEQIFGELTNHLVRETILSLEEWCVAEGKRVLLLLGGEFGRTPHQVGTINGNDTREHWASGFTWVLVSINHPTSKNVVIGDTGPEGAFTLADGNLVDPVRPSAIGGLLYTVMGFPPSDPRFHIQTIDGLRAPVDMDFVRETTADGTAAGNTPWLMDKLGLGEPI